MVAHCGGEVKGRFAAPLFERIAITNAPGPMAGYVAELALAVLLYGARNVDAHREALRRRSNAVYARIHREGAGDETLAGRTVGIFGFGGIGRALAVLRQARLRTPIPVYAQTHRDSAGDETLAGRTVGIFGFGRIGRALAALLRPLGARLLVHDPFVDAAAVRRAGATPASWTALLG